MKNYDTIVIGAGHNGLALSARVARAGRRVLVLEARNSPGGLASLDEFHPGFRAAPAHATRRLPPDIARELARHGFDAGTSASPLTALGPEGRHVIIEAGAVSGTDAADAAAFAEFRRRMADFAGALAPFWRKTIPRIGSGRLRDAGVFAHLAINIRRMGKEKMREFLRIASLPLRDLLDEHFASERLKAALCWDGLLGSKMAPRSPNGAVLMMLYRMAEGGAAGQTMCAGETRTLVAALVDTATAAGAEIRCDTAVRRILVESGSDGLHAAGVTLANGDTIRAGAIVSACDPKRTFLDLLGVRHLEIEFANRIRRLRCEGYVGKLHLALDRLPGFDGIDTPDGRLLVAPSMDALEFAYDEAKYGRCPAEPVLEAVVPTLRDASLAPPGKHVLSAHVMYVPYRLHDGWTPAARDRICRSSIDALERYAPRIRDHVLHAEFLTPADIEERYNVSGGHWHHAEFSMDQMLMMRPTYGAAQYATPVAGLFLCGSGCHPAGDLTGAAGHNAAREMLR